MLDTPESLLGRLQRGRGDAVRELLLMSAEPARQTLIQCLCTEADMSLHAEGFVELVFALSPDLSPWQRWIENLGPDVAEDTRLSVFHTLGELAIRGHGGSRAFLDRYVMAGRHWRDALSQYLVEPLSLGAADWSKLLPRVDEETLAVHVYCKIDDPLWKTLAAGDARVDKVLRAAHDLRARRQAADSWSLANYAGAALSQRRWRVLESLLERDPEAAAAYLIDGLWDGSDSYRVRCIERCDLAWPGVRDRLTQLANLSGSKCSAAARSRLDSAE